MQNSKVVNLLWTGGWDSTFRYLWLVIVAKAVVQPWYIIDTTRKSSLIELKTIKKIRTRVNEKFPYTSILTLPLKCATALEIPEDAAISAAFEKLRATGYIGSQYEWLARFAKAEGIGDLELSIHVDDKAYLFIQDSIEDISTEYGPNAKMSDKLTNKDLVVFKDFRFPVLHFSKIEMGKIAKEHHFHDLLELSWFCHSPRNGEACGVCKPCIYTIEEGLARRVPLKGRMRNQFILPVKSMLKSVLR